MYNFFSELHEFLREVWGIQHFQSPLFSSLCCLHLAYAEWMCREFHGAFSPKRLHWCFWLKWFSLAGWLGSSTLHGCCLLPLVWLESLVLIQFYVLAGWPSSSAELWLHCRHTATSLGIVCPTTPTKCILQSWHLKKSEWLNSSKILPSPCVDPSLCPAVERFRAQVQHTEVVKTKGEQRH